MKCPVLIPIGAVMASVLMMGCATGYHGRGFTGGFSTSGERAADFSLLRSADIALEHGFNYFVIIDRAHSSETSSYTTPQQSYTTGTVTAVGNTAYGSSQTTTYGGQTYHYSKPRSSNTIVCFTERPDLPTLVYDAGFVRKSLSQKYGIE